MYTRFDEFSINTKTFELMIARDLVLLERPQAVTNVPKLASEGIMFKGDRANLDVNMTRGESKCFCYSRCVVY